MSVPNIEQLRLAPRKVPLLLRCQLLFGGAMTQFGWFFFGFGMIFFWLFVPNCDWRSLEYIGMRMEQEQGIVYRIEDTHFSVGGSKNRRGKPVYANYYRFMRDGNFLYESVSYSTNWLSEGAAVTIEHPAGNPAVSRIQGMRNAPLDLWPAVFVMLFPGIGLTFMVIGINSGRRSIYLLQNGVLGYGKLESVSPTNVQVNNKTIYKFIFRYLGANGIMYKAKVLTEKAELLQDEDAEQLFFDRSNQSNAVLLDTLPGGIIVDDGGDILSKSYFYAISMSIIPLIVVLSQITFIYYTFTQ